VTKRKLKVARILKLKAKSSGFIGQ